MFNTLIVKNRRILTIQRFIGTWFGLRKKGGRFRSNCEKYPVVATKRNCTNVKRVPLYYQYDFRRGYLRRSIPLAGSTLEIQLASAESKIG